MEASDLMEIGSLTYDQTLKHKMTKPRSKHCTGPFYQLMAYQFGTFRILVRFEADCADFQAGKVEPFTKEVETLPERKKFSENTGINFVDFGETSKAVPLQLLTTYPQGAGFPFFTWAQLFFTAADQVSHSLGNSAFKSFILFRKLLDSSKAMVTLPNRHFIRCKMYPSS